MPASNYGFGGAYTLADSANKGWELGSKYRDRQLQEEQAALEVLNAQQNALYAQNQPSSLGVSGPAIPVQFPTGQRTISSTASGVGGVPAIRGGVPQQPVGQAAPAQAVSPVSQNVAALRGREVARPKQYLQGPDTQQDKLVAALDEHHARRATMVAGNAPKEAVNQLDTQIMFLTDALERGKSGGGALGGFRPDSPSVKLAGEMTHDDAARNVYPQKAQRGAVAAGAPPRVDAAGLKTDMPALKTRSDGSVTTTESFKGKAIGQMPAPVQQAMTEVSMLVKQVGARDLSTKHKLLSNAIRRGDTKQITAIKAELAGIARGGSDVLPAIQAFHRGDLRGGVAALGQLGDIDASEIKGYRPSTWKGLPSMEITYKDDDGKIKTMNTAEMLARHQAVNAMAATVKTAEEANYKIAQRLQVGEYAKYLKKQSKAKGALKAIDSAMNAFLQYSRIADDASYSAAVRAQADQLAANNQRYMESLDAKGYGMEIKEGMQTQRGRFVGMIGEEGVMFPGDAQAISDANLGQLGYDEYNRQWRATDQASGQRGAIPFGFGEP